VIGFGQVSGLILVEVVSNLEIVLHEQSAINDLKGFDLDGCGVALGRAVSAESAELWLVFGGIAIEGGFVFGGREIIFGTFIRALKLRSALDGLALREERDRIITLESYASFVEILQRFWGLRHDGKSQKKAEQKDEFSDERPRVYIRVLAEICHLPFRVDGGGKVSARLQENVSLVGSSSGGSALE
jgi:hypothetical protein